MKVGMKRMLGIGFLAALSGLMSTEKLGANPGANPMVDLRSPIRGNSFGAPIWYGKSCKSKRTNKQRCSHNAKLKRRKG